MRPSWMACLVVLWLAFGVGTSHADAGGAGHLEQVNAVRRTVTISGVELPLATTATVRGRAGWPLTLSELARYTGSEVGYRLTGRRPTVSIVALELLDPNEDD